MADKKIMIIDDDPDLITIMEAYLSKIDGITIVTAEDGKEGVEKVKVENPDLIVLDIQMPEMNGFEVFAALEKDDEVGDIPIIMLTSVKEQTGIGFSAEEMKGYFGKEPKAYFEKPANTNDTLLNKAKELLGL